jgi:hypothetical protein
MTTLEALTTKINTSLLVDKEYVLPAVGERSQVKTASFSQVSNINELDAGDKILLFTTDDDYAAMMKAIPHLKLGCTWRGCVDARSHIPILVEIKTIEKLPADSTLSPLIKIKELGMNRTAEYAQVWRFVG